MTVLVLDDCLFQSALNKISLAEQSPVGLRENLRHNLGLLPRKVRKFDRALRLQANQQLCHRIQMKKSLKTLIWKRELYEGRIPARHFKLEHYKK